MKLIRFSIDTSPVEFGVVIANHAVSFNTLQELSTHHYPCLNNSQAYLEALPESEVLARGLLDWGTANLPTMPIRHKPLLSEVTLHAPIEVKALFDLGLTPRHLKNSAETLLAYEKDNPQTAGLIQALRQILLKPKAEPVPGQPERLSYYKCNLNSVCGDGVTIPWPRYTARLDIEPELAVVYGNAKQPVAGYCIFNDVSARDVQAPEIIGGFCLTKDMDSGNQLGPYLVTADEVGDPYSLAVTVVVNDAVRYSGSTSEISHKVEEMFAWMNLVCPLKPGTVLGFGTIPDCTGLDHDDFLDPNSSISIHFERLGSLHCRFAEPAGRLLPSRWPLRASLEKFA